MSDVRLQRIPPFSPAETIKYYETGEIPERFSKPDDAVRDEIIGKFLGNTDFREEEVIY